MTQLNARKSISFPPTQDFLLLQVNFFLFQPEIHHHDDDLRDDNENNKVTGCLSESERNFSYD